MPLRHGKAVSAAARFLVVFPLPWIHVTSSKTCSSENCFRNAFISSRMVDVIFAITALSLPNTIGL